MAKKRPTVEPGTARIVENVRLGDLLDHPDQAVYFPLNDEHKFDELVESVRVTNVQTPLGVLPQVISDLSYRRLLDD
jgi:hypothetical protein